MINLYYLLLYILILYVHTEATCIEERQKRLADNRIGTYVPYCMENNPSLYYQMQCHGSTGFCWCADVETGKKLTDNFRYGEVDCEQVL